MKSDTTMTIFAIRLRAYREQKNLSVAKLANASGITKAYLYDIESGKSTGVGLLAALRLAEALGISIYDLLPQQIGHDANICPNCSGYESAFRKLEAKCRDVKTQLALIVREL